MKKKESCARYSGIGGQAVMEGIMMRNKGRYAIAVRKPDGDIEVKTEDYKSIINVPALQNVPILRGVINFVDSLVMGIRCLMYSASFFEEEEDGDKKKKEKGLTDSGTVKKSEKESTDPEANKEEKSSDNLFVAGTISIALVMAVFLFMVVPLFVSRKIGAALPPIGRSAVESGIRVAVFLGYMVAISKIKDIQRTYEYHGAEHKCINCIENGRELTVENVMLSSRLHKRCGTSFLFFVILVSVVFQMFIHSDNRLTQVGVRLLLIPVIAGVSYEIIRLAGISEHPLVTLLSKPGLALQKLTTREPDTREAEVAIRAVEAVFDWRAFLEGKEGTLSSDGKSGA